MLCAIASAKKRDICNLKEYRAMAEENKVIFSMSGVSKILPHNNKAILKDIYLGFYYGAKIGIIGLNGSGKSTLLNMVGLLDTPDAGSYRLAGVETVGLPEESRGQLRREKIGFIAVGGNQMKGVSDLMAKPGAKIIMLLKPKGKPQVQVRFGV